MDKYEYKIRTEEIKTLIARGKYADAAEIADGIDWRRVKSVMMLCTISDLYKMNRRYEDSRDLLLLAYDRHPGGRSIVYSLCELSIKMGEFVQAVEYYKEFVQVAPRDNGRYILQYKLYEAQEVSLEERIEVLEELKSKEYVDEKWAYELAYLYHRVGLATKCVEECDSLILWFGEGKYVMKAMELKMLHEPLTPEQQEKYDFAKGLRRLAAAEEDAIELDSGNGKGVETPTLEMPSKDLDIQVKVMGVGQYDTINMQKELAEHMKELWEGTETKNEQGEVSSDTRVAFSRHEIQEETPENATKQEQESPEMPAEAEISGKESTENVEVSAAVESILVEEKEPITETEVFFGETADMDRTASLVMEAMRNEAAEMVETAEADEAAETAETVEVQKMGENQTGQMYISGVMGMGDMKEIRTSDKPEKIQEVKDSLYGYDKMLGMEYDGQISMLLPESEQIEKQITGQIKLEDVLLEWERMKLESEQKRRAAVEQRVLQQTGAMFTEFEAAIRDGLLEKLEREKNVDTIVPETFMEEPEEFEELEEIEEPEEEMEEPEEETEEPEEEMEEPEEETEELEEEMEEPEEETEEPEEEMEEPEEEMEEPEEEIEEAEEEIEESEEVENSLRPLSPEEQELFGLYAHSPKSREQIINAIDNISMASYTGNVIITGDENMDTLTLAKNLVREIQITDNNFSGKIAKISGAALNRKDMEETLNKMADGALIVQKAGGMTAETVSKLNRALEQEERGIILLLIDTKKGINGLLKETPALTRSFTLRVDVEALSNKALVELGKKYAYEREYCIDEMGVLALHTAISERQSSDHAVTPNEVQEIIEEAIRSANRKTIGHFFDILIGRRYDEEDMIILREKDFA